MDIICAPSGIVGTVRPAQGIADVIRAGFQNLFLDVSRFCSPEELETMGLPGKAAGSRTRPLISENPDSLPTVMNPILAQYQKAGLSTPVALAPYQLPGTKRTDLTPLLAGLSRESIRLCGQAGCGFIIIRPVFSGLSRGEAWQANRDFYLSLAPLAGDNHVQILLENQCHDQNGHLIRGICSDPGEAAAWVDRLNEAAGEERFGFCMDVGACSICGQNMQAFAHVLDRRIKAVILRDNDGHRESSLLPFTYSGFERSGTDWLGLIRGLRGIGFDGHLILDFSTTAAGFSPLLRPQLLQLAKATGEYFQWQIGMENLLKAYKARVLFGAGNMCRNYMKCYGKTYPPLFTCDNNPKLWGTRFEGLEVKSPESLRDLPADCAVFICNVYYREIQQQLREMGLTNPMEFFSDEFMPSFYFDRLERGE